MSSTNDALRLAIFFFIRISNRSSSWYLETRFWMSLRIQSSSPSSSSFAESASLSLAFGSRVPRGMAFTPPMGAEFALVSFFSFSLSLSSLPRSLFQLLFFQSLPPQSFFLPPLRRFGDHARNVPFSISRSLTVSNAGGLRASVNTAAIVSKSSVKVSMRVAILSTKFCITLMLSAMLYFSPRAFISGYLSFKTSGTRTSVATGGAALAGSPFGMAAAGGRAIAIWPSARFGLNAACAACIRCIACRICACCGSIPCACCGSIPCSCICC
mmetsp:Transcript_147268/g.274340  ORF Transcript_147268/g.274340 Transcript_147268/m.274340 type:complete len:270 (-) Transcript_147268:818-1627(-)